MIDIFVLPVQDKDLSAIVRIHTAAFPKSALGQLGSEAVYRYYHWQLKDQPQAVAMGIYQGSNLVGFCFAGVFSGALSGFLRKNRRFLTLRVLTHPWLILSPIFCEKLFLANSIFFRPKKKTLLQIHPTQKSFGILAIATDPQIQGAGFGRRLMHEIEQIALARGFCHMYLTVEENNFQAIGFYEKLGWQKESQADSVWRGIMVKIL